MSYQGHSANSVTICLYLIFYIYIKGRKHFVECNTRQSMFPIRPKSCIGLAEAQIRRTHTFALPHAPSPAPGRRPLVRPPGPPLADGSLDLRPPPTAGAAPTTDTHSSPTTTSPAAAARPQTLVRRRIPSGHVCSALGASLAGISALSLFFFCRLLFAECFLLFAECPRH